MINKFKSTLVFVALACTQQAFASSVTISSVPTSWAVGWTFSPNSTTPGYVYLSNTGALNSAGKPCLVTGSLTLTTTSTKEEERLLYNTILTAKISQAKVHVTYENTTCVISDIAIKP